MILTEFYKAQAKLDEVIEKSHPPKKNENRLNKKLIAFLVELSEMLNEKRSIFKFWSNKKDDNKKALVEYVDGFHFLLSIGLEVGYTSLEIESYVLDYHDIQVQVLETYRAASSIMEFDNYNYERAFELYLGLGEMLGFTENQIKEAYYAKNEINHVRQAEGY